MKKIKILFWIIIFAIAVVFVFQNQPLFLEQQTIRIDLRIVSYELPHIPNAIILMASFLIGVLVSYFFNLAERFRSKKMVKQLNAAVDSLQQEISTLKSRSAPPNDSAPSEKEDQAA